MEISKEFIDGINFAIAVIEDRQARLNLCRPYKETKKAKESYTIKNLEISYALDHLNHIKDSDYIDEWIKEYQEGKLWKFDPLKY
jgi:hypothetical protein